MAIKLICKKSNGEQYDITKVLTKVTWSGDYKSCSRKLEFSLLYSGTDKNVPNIDIPLSSHVIFYENDVELFRGYVWEREKNSTGTTINYLAYDNGERLNKIKISYNIKDQTPSAIVDKICTEYKLNKGNIASSSVKIKKVFIGVSLYNLIMSAYTEESKRTGKKYMVEYKQDKLYVTEKGTVTLSVGFEEGKNITSTSFKESLSSVVNRVLIVDENGSFVSEVKDQNLINLHGLFQEVYRKVEGKDANEEAKALLKDVEQTCTLSGFGDTSCITGKGVQIKDSHTGLIGLFYIDSDSHTWEGEKYSIDLDLNFKNIMNEVSAGQDETGSTSSSSSSNNSSSSSSPSTTYDGNSMGAKLVAKAKTQLGCKYVWGATGPNTFDCSGLTSWVHKQFGISIPRTSLDQSRSGKAVSRSALQPGDLIFWKTTSAPVGHVGMYVGDGKFIHAPNSRSVVKIDSLSSSYYSSRYVNARRYW